MPWTVAKRLFQPHMYASKLVKRLGFWRSLLGVATLVIASVGVRSAYDVVTSDTGGKVLNNGIHGLLAVPVAVAVVYFATLPRFRRQLGFRPLLRKLALMTVTLIVPVVLINLFWVGKDLPDMNPVLTLLVVLALSWYLVYLICVMYWAGRTFCWIGDFHPLLAPVMTALMVTGFTTLTLVEADTKGLAQAAWIVITISGLVTTLLLALVEYRTLRRGRIGWRTGPAAEPLTSRGFPSP